ncbi:MAG: DUF998 domain-containing protein [Actinomycetota bacterium]
MKRTTAPPACEAVERPAHRATGASLIALILVLMCFGAVMLLHVLRGEIDPLRQVMSEYANGSHGLIMTVVFYGFGLSSLALAFRLRRAIDLEGVTRLFPGLLAAAGVCLIASGIFEVERALVPDSVEEVIHSNASVVAFVLLIASMLLFSYACTGDDRWWTFRWTSTAIALSAAAAAMATPLTAQTGWSGLVQRLLSLTVLLWFLLTALRVRGKRFSST